DSIKQLSNGERTGAQIQDMLVAEKQIEPNLAKVLNHADINASQSQGFINEASGPISQVFINGNIDLQALVDVIRESTTAQATDPSADLYRQQFMAALRGLPASKYNFPLTCRFVSATGAPIESEASIPIEHLIDRLQIERLVILRGS